ncbi:prepilin-type N-terminal cleavage/methylation domain-containing protein [Curvibacter sp. APW13]|uniref:prepilin-type N-terminal cleavage/methylation domain-containing protein n=1 Tax=Curvibacter sp. APW13 TaxID=3077236 RepID=UPI0028DF2805|nr:prepilin-type N-terminal cleavage/methylation domain-containing protein [Curvibacter sp. APW13]MDT8990219.1 prepilin-type N-terminal cleavage/methylation domain-containing protein [Curvibacter sp. APW13]
MTKRTAQGFTLIEVIIFIVVVASGLAGILLVSNTVVASSADPMVRKQALAVAESMLEEITLKEYCDPDTATLAPPAAPVCPAARVAADQEASRNLWDDVDDYNGYSTAGGIVDVTGATVPGLSTYNVAVSVAAPATVTGGGATVLKAVTVTVTWSGGSVVLVGYKGNY